MPIVTTDTEAVPLVVAHPAAAAAPARGLAGKRVIVIHSSLEVGGAEAQSLHLAQYLREHGDNHVEVWGFGPPGDLTARCERLGIPWRAVAVDWRVGRWHRALTLVRLTRLLRSARPDVLLPYTDLPNILVGAVWRFTGAAVCVWSNRGADAIDSRSRLARQVIHHARWFLCNSEHRREHLIAKFGVPADRIHVIPNGVALAGAKRDAHAWRASLGLAEDVFAACMIANMTGYKDHVTLLRAWRLVLDRCSGPAPVLVLAGRHGDKSDEVMRLCAELRLGESVRVLGFVDDIAGLLSAMNVAAFSALLEGLPNGVLEAMAAGLAVVATDDAGVREALGPASDALIAPPGSPELLADRLLWCMEHPEELRRLAAANLQRIATTFAVEAMGRRTSEWLSSLVGAAARPLTPASVEP